MSNMLRRRKGRSAKRQRGEILLRILGRSRYSKVRDLVKNVRYTKIKKVASLKCKGEVCGKTFDSNLPPVVRRLYFETRLVQAFEKYPTERLRNLDWDLLVTEAEQNLEEFLLWEAEHTMS